ncbi:aminopeptidase P family protein [Xylanibacillus composti]|uniref:Xaa-Pro dipeptidase n=1 Tax=Xylanibacillus composti TaxID=1572762 RepID=A0A8J4M439_9BACL|nr:Xaa-Pro peptidase family protein [Xylanibacillus composti]MDT9726271.1 aminopeptidase P family protein [Xylanibacillus composti]GIQ70700.1 Xaa-Pro dipeptidase [Xylanibacillus composti]
MTTAHRVQALRKQLDERGLAALWITSPTNRRYLTGFTGSSGYVLVTMDQALLFSDFRYRTQAPEQAPDFAFIEHGPRITDTLAQVAAEQKLDRIGFEHEHMTVAQHRQYEETLGSVQWVPAGGIVEELRMIKDEAELKVMQEAADLADRAFEHICTYLRPGLTEQEVALELELFMRKGGASSASFETIVASGERSALPHGVASDRVLKNGEFVKMDFGAYYQGYCSDITRTVALGQPGERHREIYAIVLEAQLHALEEIKPGMTGREADALTRDIIKRYGYSDYFGHGTGHGLGLDIHEAPRLSVGSDTVLKPGMTVTVEPGIYLPEFGGVRIEDDIVITETGCRRLTQSSKELRMIG